MRKGQKMCEMGRAGQDRAGQRGVAHGRVAQGRAGRDVD